MPATKENLPGYPHYPEREDITRPENNNGRVQSEPAHHQQAVNEVDDDQNSEDLLPDADTDVTEEERLLLEAADLNMNTPDDLNLLFSALDSTDADGDPLNEPEGLMRDFTGTSLDVPGSDADDQNEALGEEDEENNYYSLGGDNHENQEEYKGE
ncbi:MAG: hypothetical protein EBZ77_08330 [Chitinophagia bacterium]|nr:hypothetical protein [Chitinophagia bacterium]